MEVFLLRHGEAGTHQNTADDWQRPLTAEGVGRIQREAETLARWKVPIDMLVSSPFTRARQTADAVAEAFHLNVVEDQLLESRRFDLNALEKLLEKYSKAEHLMLAGHEPDFSMVLSGLVGGGTFKLEKGGLARVQLDSRRPPRGTLLWLLTPDVLGA